MKFIDLTEIGLKDWDIARGILLNSGVNITVHQEELRIHNVQLFEEIMQENSLLRELLTNIEEPLYK